MGCKGNRLLPLPSVAPAPLVTTPADILRARWEHRCPLRHVQHALTGLIGRDNNRLAHITRCVRERAATTTLARFCSDAPWCQDPGKARRSAALLQPPQAVRGPHAAAALRLDETLCAHGGRVFDAVARHDAPGDDPSPLAHHPGTRPEGSGPGRCPLALRLARRDAARTPWATGVRPPCPARPSPTTQPERARRPTAVAPVWLDAPALQPWPQPCRTQIDVGLELVAAARQPTVPWRVLVFDPWSRAAALVSMARAPNQDGGSWLQKPRHLATHRLVLQAAAGHPIRLAGPHMAGADLVPRIPPPAYRAVTGGDKTSWTLPRAGERPAGGQLPARGVDGHRCRVGAPAGGRACATAPPPGWATLAHCHL